ncbi:MAG TPA: LemA family protein, partial [Propionibacteriaceae bacterium]|nr:LemA family protein [Propionibacteriaceae bacterium]
MTGFWIVLVIIAVVIVAGIGMVVGPYNRFVRLRNTIQESWRQVDVELNRRYELIPNLVETVKGYAAHESSTLEDVVRLRNQAASLAQTGSQPQRAAVESQLSEQIGRLMVSVEAYPQLQANQNFLELQRQLADTEDRIAAGRRYYNANVRAYNTSIEQMPGNLVANAFHFEKAG